MQLANWDQRMKDIQASATLEGWLMKASDEELFRINLKALGRRLETDWQDLLPSFLLGVRSGLFTLQWSYYCEHCGGLPGFKHNFGELKTEDTCPLCSSTFRNTLDKNIGVYFTIHPGVRELPASLAEKAFDEMVKGFKDKILKIPSEMVTGMEVLNNSLFQELFGQDVLATEETLEISRVTLLFTDIKGSTRMYSTHGDSASYRIVREHFKILFQQIEKNRGVVVKTIGDAVMASFLKPEDGLKAALGAYEAFQTIKWDKVGMLEIKMGLHTGGAIVVTLNDRVDYFGNTVNKAARIQGLAENHTVCLSEDIFDDPATKDLLAIWSRENHRRVKHSRVRLKGIDGKVGYYQLQ